MTSSLMFLKSSVFCRPQSGGWCCGASFAAAETALPESALLRVLTTRWATLPGGGSFHRILLSVSDHRRRFGASSKSGHLGSIKAATGLRTGGLPTPQGRITGCTTLIYNDIYIHCALKKNIYIYFYCQVSHLSPRMLGSDIRSTADLSTAGNYSPLARRHCQQRYLRNFKSITSIGCRCLILQSLLKL